VRELAPGVWHWEAPHPEWEGSVRWGQVVSSYAIDDGERLLLFDPIAPPSEILELAAQREPAIVLTCPWHERDTRSLVERCGAPVYAPPPDTAEDLMRIYGVTAEAVAGWRSPDLAWLLDGDTGEAHPYAAGDRLPVGVEAFPGNKPNGVVLWIENRRAVVVGDTLVDFGQGLDQPPADFGYGGLPPGVTREQIAEGLRPLLELPVEHVLATHGGPTDRAALDRALSST
jgi:glyoxylase-like metal-dependent hydrolase (beta-lactamase superfamily II)